MTLFLNNKIMKLIYAYHNFASTFSSIINTFWQAYFVLGNLNFVFGNPVLDLAILY